MCVRRPGKLSCLGQPIPVMRRPLFFFFLFFFYVLLMTRGRLSGRHPGGKEKKKKEPKHFHLYRGGRYISQRFVSVCCMPACSVWFPLQAPQARVLLAAQRA